SSTNGFHTRCASGEVMVGMWGSASSTVTGVGALCASTATVSAGGSTARRDSLTGSTGTVGWERRCPPYMALKGFRGRLDDHVRRLEPDCQRYGNGQSVTTAPETAWVGPSSGYEV